MPLYTVYSFGIALETQREIEAASATKAKGDYIKRYLHGAVNNAGWTKSQFFKSLRVKKGDRFS